jgi:hypothetical protein
MKILQVVPKPGTNSKLKTILKKTERTIRGPHTTFHRMREGRWKHVSASYSSAHCATDKAVLTNLPIRSTAAIPDGESRKVGP